MRRSSSSRRDSSSALMPGSLRKGVCDGDSYICGVCRETSPYVGLSVYGTEYALTLRVVERGLSGAVTSDMWSGTTGDSACS